jgi:two-component system chemotaxis response regulator CheB
MSDSPLRILVVDDSALYRKIVRDLLLELPDVEIVGAAADGKAALEKIDTLSPDLIILDREMPISDGIAVLKELGDRLQAPGTILLSSHTSSGTRTTMRALELVAFDFVLKPTGHGPDESKRLIRKHLHPKVEAFRRTRPIRSATPAAVTTSKSESDWRHWASVASRCSARAEVVALGVSTGGPAALAKILPCFPADTPAPILIVQHMPPMFTKSMAEDLDRVCPLAVSEAEDGQPARPGEVLIAPGGKQMKIARSNKGLVIRVVDDPPERNCRPSVDYLFRSVAETCGPAALGVIMTGMGNDGTAGIRLMQQRGAAIIAQDEASCVVFGMPAVAVQEGLADYVAPLMDIPKQILRCLKKGAEVRT